MDALTSIAGLTVGLAALALVGQVVVTHAVALARRLDVSDLTVGFLAVSIATTLPELLVSAVSVAEGQSELALGNVFGSNIVNLTAVLGIAAYVGRIALDSKERTMTTRILFFLIMVPLGVMAVGVNGLTGFALLAGYGIFVIATLKAKTKIVRPQGAGNHAAKHTAFLLGAGAVLAVAAHLTVDSATALSVTFGLSETLIGATLIAVGTSLPELAVAVQSVRNNHDGVALGNLLGASVTNLTLNLGMAALIGPIKVPLAQGMLLAVVSFIVGSTLWWFARDRKYLSRNEGYVLLGLFGAYVAALGIMEWA